MRRALVVRARQREAVLQAVEWAQLLDGLL